MTDSQRDDASRAVARLFERLLTEACRVELLEAMKFEGASAVTTGFRVLAESAWDGVVSQPNVSGFLFEIFKHIDMQKLRTLSEAFDFATMTDGPAVRVVSDSSTTVLELWGLAPSDLTRLKEQTWTPSRWNRLWRIADPGASSPRDLAVSDVPALAGSYVVTDRTVVFVPAVALKRGASYTWYFFPCELPSSPAPSEPALAWRRANFISMEVRVP